MSASVVSLCTAWRSGENPRDRARRETVKGDTKGRCRLAWQRRKCANIFTSRLRCGYSINSYAKDYFFLSFEFELLGRNHTGSLFTNEHFLLFFFFNLKDALFATCCILLPHVYLVCDITDSDCQTQNGLRSRSCFLDFHTSICNKRDNKSTKKLLWVFFFFYSVPVIGPVMRFRFASPLNREPWRKTCLTNHNSINWLFSHPSFFFRTGRTIYNVLLRFLTNYRPISP